MSAQTHIEWCDSTFNPWIGCTKVSPACDHCYAAVSTPARALGVVWGPGQTRRRTSAANWRQPLRWNAHPFVECPDCRWRGEAREMHWGDTCPGAGCFGKPQPTRRRVFCASLADVFDNELDPQWRADLFDLILATPNLDWLLLTKRIGNVQAMVIDATLMNFLPSNVWLGATICNQAEANRDIPKLLAAPAAVRFLSMEPLLGPVSLTEVYGVPHNAPFSALRRHGCVQHAPGYCMSNCTGRWPAVDWVIAGGESGQHARPLRADWIRSLRDQCAAADVPFLFKQWGEWAPYGRGREDYRQAPQSNFADEPMQRFGKKLAGRLLDGIEHNGFPRPSENRRAAGISV